MDAPFNLMFRLWGNNMQVSTMVDGCHDLIHKKALQAFSRITPENRRWIDPEDVIQDGFIAAWEAEQGYRSDRGAKFSTYLWHGLDMLYNGRYHVPLKQHKRVAKAMKELDAPAYKADASNEPAPVWADLIPSKDPSPEKVFEAITAALEVCRALPPRALRFFLLVVTSSKDNPERPGRDFIACIPDACRRYGVRREDLALIMADRFAKGKLVDGVVKTGADFGDMGTKKAEVLECYECRGKFTLEDARAGTYSATSLTCLKCLQKLHARGPDLTCFGRLKVVENDKVRTEGFCKTDTECRLHCRDRAACVQFIKNGKREGSMTEDFGNIELEADLDDMSFDDIETGDEGVIESGEAEVEEAPKAAPKKAAAPKKTAAPVKPAPVKAAAPKKAAVKTAPVKAAPVKAATKAATKAPAKTAPAKTAPAKTVARSATKAAPGNPKAKRIEPDGKMDLREAKKLGLIKLDDQGRDMPFKANSMMRYSLEQAMEPGGVSEKTLEAFAVKHAYDYRYQRAVLVSGRNGGTSVRPYATTHTWDVEVDEKKKRITVSNLKRIAFYKKIGRIFKK